MSGSGGNGRGKKKKTPSHGQKHTHSGGSAAVLGARIAKYTAIQGSSLLLSNVLHAASIVYVARQLGAADLGKYSLLLFLSGLITQVFHLFSKPGTLRRVFGQADDDDAGAEGDFSEGEHEDEASATPQRSLGVGIIWVVLLGIVGCLLTIVFRGPLAAGLLGSSRYSDLIFWAGILGGAGAIFKLCDIVIWFERRPITFVIVDASRPLFNLILMAYLIHRGMGVKGAIEGAAIGTSAATLLSVLALVRSFELAFEWSELKLILLRGVGRIPIAMSMWAIQNADTFILSRYVDHSQVGYYNLAQKLGFMVSFLPQGFRIAMRPLRKSALFQAVRDQYGTAVAKGQLLAYFCLLSMIAILSMILGGTLIINQASPRFQAAAPLIPLTAAAMTMPALFRTINGQTYFQHKRPWFIAAVIAAALMFVGWMMLLVPRFGIIGTPIAAILGFGASCAFLFIKGQRGPSPVDFPYRAMLTAALMAAAVAVFFKFVHPADKWLQLAEITMLMLVYTAALFITRVIPPYHRGPLLHIARSTFRRRPHGFDRSEALGALGPRQRELLRDAVVNRIPLEVFAAQPANGERRQVPANGGGPAASVDPARLVKFLRRAGKKGGVPVGKVTEHDARIAKFLFADAPTAARNATMRGLVSAGAESNDLRALEDLVDYLSHTPAHEWEGRARRLPVVRIKRR